MTVDTLSIYIALQKDTNKSAEIIKNLRKYKRHTI
jgi:hypothetical protein